MSCRLRVVVDCDKWDRGPGGEPKRCSAKVDSTATLRAWLGDHGAVEVEFEPDLPPGGWSSPYPNRFWCPEHSAAVKQS